MALHWRPQTGCYSDGRIPCRELRYSTPPDGFRRDPRSQSCPLAFRPMDSFPPRGIAWAAHNGIHCGSLQRHRIRRRPTHRDDYSGLALDAGVFGMSWMAGAEEVPPPGSSHPLATAEADSSHIPWWRTWLAVRIDWQEQRMAVAWSSHTNPRQKWVLVCWKQWLRELESDADADDACGHSVEVAYPAMEVWP